jgi:hypothetical protein
MKPNAKKPIATDIAKKNANICYFSPGFFWPFLGEKAHYYQHEICSDKVPILPKTKGKKRTQVTHIRERRKSSADSRKMATAFER